MDTPLPGPITPFLIKIVLLTLNIFVITISDYVCTIKVSRIHKLCACTVIPLGVFIQKFVYEYYRTLVHHYITICFIDHKNDDNLVCTKRCAAFECFHTLYYFRATHLDTRVFTHYRLREERHFTQWYAIISFALHSESFWQIRKKYFFCF